MTHIHKPYCDNLLLDCDAPIFEGPLFRAKRGGPMKKLKDLMSPNSEDAVTWSVFRMLERHFKAVPWVQGLLRVACGESIHVTCPEPSMCFWELGWPQDRRLLWLLDHSHEPRIAGSAGNGKDPKRIPNVKANQAEYRQRVLSGKIRGRAAWILEGPTQFDVLIRCPGVLVAMEAKYTSDIDDHVRWDAGRDQIGRVIDVGLSVAQQEHRELYFLLITDGKPHVLPLLYEQLMPSYQSDLAFLAKRLPHRPSEELEGLQNHVGWISWRQIVDWLDQQHSSLDASQHQWLTRAQWYLQQRHLC